jgi:hypothetical protein
MKKEKNRSDRKMPEGCWVFSFLKYGQYEDLFSGESLLYIELLF